MECSPVLHLFFIHGYFLCTPLLRCRFLYLLVEGLRSIRSRLRLYFLPAGVRVHRLRFLRSFDGLRRQRVFLRMPRRLPASDRGFFAVTSLANSIISVPSSMLCMARRMARLVRHTFTQGSRS